MNGFLSLGSLSKVTVDAVVQEIFGVCQVCGSGVLRAVVDCGKHGVCLLQLTVVSVAVEWTMGDTGVESISVLKVVDTVGCGCWC